MDEDLLPDKATTSASTDRIDDVLQAALPDLATWMPSQRWYAGAGSGAVRTSVLGWTPLAEATGRPSDVTGAAGPWAPGSYAVIDAVIRVRPVTGDDSRARDDAATDDDSGGRAGAAMAASASTDEGSGVATDYQVPLLLASAPADRAATPDPEAFVGTVEYAGSRVRVLDATRTDVGRRAVLGMLGGDRAVTSSRLLEGEQSNSSLIFEYSAGAATKNPGRQHSGSSHPPDGYTDREPEIAKLFRVLHGGQNPDVSLQEALGAGGSTRIAPLVGSAVVEYVDDATGARVRADALLVQQFFPGVEDAWRVALREARAGEDFTTAARDLGEATAQVHGQLAEVMPTKETPAETGREMTMRMLERLDRVRSQVPQVDERGDDLAAVLRRCAQVQWPPMQRIHGDLHLGQVLAAPDHGWVLLDFEGEPLRALDERNAPDCPVRDVAGMLRSLDYVGGALRLEHGADVTAWVANAREAFLAGYLAAAGIDADDLSFRILLAAFEVDKAVYEVLYETRHRPTWIPIPLGALDRLADPDNAPAHTLPA